MDHHFIPVFSTQFAIPVFSTQFAIPAPDTAVHRRLFASFSIHQFQSSKADPNQNRSVVVGQLDDLLLPRPDPFCRFNFATFLYPIRC